MRTLPDPGDRRRVGRHPVAVYAGWEAPLAKDGDQRGRGIIRIQRYTGTPGGTYALDGQFAFMADDGMYLSELSAIDDNGNLLALERQYTAGLGSEIRIVQLSLAHAQDITELTSPPRPRPPSTRSWTTSRAWPSARPGRPAATKGRHPLYLVSDDNDNDSGDQLTRLYSFAVKLRP
ncbi:esterase-like activity of phytase family protein [Streptomyces olivaceoviridis]|uniref:esterase-like activity of phytase family protein n=1 Tax=Streptomyces olivaceoviridis TaxID=1921 RepID=UPI0036FBDEC2